MSNRSMMFGRFIFTLLCIPFSKTVVTAERINYSHALYRLEHGIEILTNLSKIDVMKGMTLLGCAFRCFSNSECCVASYNHHTNDCILDNSRCCFIKRQASPDSTLIAKPENLGRKPTDCHELGLFGFGVCTIYPEGACNGVPVYCLDSWTMIQLRSSNELNFTRNWMEYKNGFGDPSKNFWIGLENLYLLTSHRQYRLVILMYDNTADTQAYYDYFAVGDETSSYRLTIGSYSGSAGDALRSHNQMQFSTYDQDNDVCNFTKNCASNTGGWWFNCCYESNLNGNYDTSGFANGIAWGSMTIVRGHMWIVPI